ELITNSNTFEQYKVIKKVNLDAFRAVISDSLKKGYKELSVAKNVISDQKNSIASLEEELDETLGELEKVTEERDSISFIGMAMNKSGYQVLVWSIIGILILVLLIFIYKFVDSNRVTVQS